MVLAFFAFFFLLKKIFFPLWFHFYQDIRLPIASSSLAPVDLFLLLHSPATILATPLNSINTLSLFFYFLCSCPQDFFSQLFATACAQRFLAFINLPPLLALFHTPSSFTSYFTGCHTDSVLHPYSVMCICWNPETQVIYDLVNERTYLLRNIFLLPKRNQVKASEQNRERKKQTSISRFVKKVKSWGFEKKL